MRKCSNFHQARPTMNIYIDTTENGITNDGKSVQGYLINYPTIAHFNNQIIRIAH